MSKLLKTLAIIFALVITIIVALGAYLLIGFDPNSYKPQIETAAREQGVELNISGELGLSLWPNLAIVVGETRFESSSQGIHPSSFQQANLVLSWSGLLNQQVAVKALNIEQANINLTQAEQGLAIAAAPATASKPVTSADQRFALAVDQLSITDSKVNITQDGQSHTLSDLNVDVEKVNLEGAAFPVSLAFHYAGTALEQPLPVSLTTDVTVDSDRQVLALNNLSAQLEAIQVKGDITVADYLATPNLDGNLTLATENLKGALASFTGEKMATKNPKALTEFSFSTAIKGSVSDLQLNDLTLKLDKTTLKGKAAFSNGAQRKLSLILSGDQIAVDDYMSPDASNDSSNVEPQAGGVLLAPVLGPLALLDGGTGHVELRMQQLAYGGATLNNSTVILDAKGKQLSITRLDTNAFDGSVAFKGSLDGSGKTPRLKLNGQLTGINLKKALQQIDQDVDLEGILTLSFAGNTAGLQSEDLIMNLRGGGDLSIEKPVLSTINLEQNYCELAALVEKTPARTAPWPPGTKLNKLTSQYHFDQGKLVLDQYNTGIGNLKVRGNGAIALLEETFAIKVITLLEGDRTSEAGCVVKSKRIRNKEIPLLCKDSFAKAGPKSCKPDPDFVNKLLKEEVIDKLKEKTGMSEESSKAVEGLLRGIFGGSN